VKTGQVVAALAAFLLCFFCAAPSGYLSRTYRLSRGYGATGGVITARIPNSHGTVLVHYSAAGATFERALGPSTSDAGSSITVYYSLEDPGVSQLVRPSIMDGLGLLLIMFSLAVAVATGFVVRAAYGPRARSGILGLGRPKPRLYCLVVAAAIAIGNLAGGPRPLAMTLALLGCVLLIYTSWRGDPSWRDLIRKRAFWAAFILLLSASVV
jgi:hypothetical protein